MSVKHIILGVISWKPSTGYEIKAEVEYQGRQLAWGKVSYGSIYPKLKELEKDGFVTVEERGDTERRTKQYDLTKKGWEELEDWLETAPSYPVFRDELLMKMSFWDHVFSPDDRTLVSHLKKRKQETKEMLDHFVRWENNEVSTIGTVASFSLDYLTSQLESELNWIEKTLDRIKNNEEGSPKDPNDLINQAARRREEKATDE